MSRRLFLAAAVGGGMLAGAGTAAASEFAGLRVRWRDLLLGTGFNPTVEPFSSRLAGLGATTTRLRKDMRIAPGSLWPDAVFTAPAPGDDAEAVVRSGRIRDSYERLRTMAFAYNQPNTGHTHDPELLKCTLRGLEHMNAEVYRAGRETYGNWYHWRIGAPQAMQDACVLLYEHVPAESLARYLAAVDHFVPDREVEDRPGVSLGSNRVNHCQVLALRGVLGQDAVKVALARDALSAAMAQVTSGDGIHPDGSFIQHERLPYAGAYGVDYLTGLGLLFALLAGSTWQITHPDREVVLGSVRRTWAPLIFDGLVFDAVSGRAISRGLRAGAGPGAIQEDDHARGHALIAGIALLAKGAPPTERDHWHGLVKGWVQRDTRWPVLTDRSVDFAGLTRLAAIAADPAVTALPEPAGHRLFPWTDRAVHRGPGWAAVVSMASRRIAHYEYGNGENFRGWHTGAGMLCWWGDRGQYSDGFWPTVDPYLLPGTTASTKPLADGEGGDYALPVPPADWVGGTTDGVFAAVGQHLHGLSSSLTARKSWFFAEDAVVCLGAGVHCKDGTTVRTVVDNRNLGERGVAVLTVDGVAQPAGFPWAASLTNPRWAHLHGHGGYLFPDDKTVRAQREERTGRWRDINVNGSTEPVTRRYQTLWFDHGATQAKDAYRYVLLPGATAERTRARAADLADWLTVLDNTEQVQGVALPEIGVTAVNFWTAGATAPLTATAPCSVLARICSDGTAALCVAAPTRDVRSLTVTWRRPVAAVLSAPPTVVATRTGQSLSVDFGDLSGTAGATQVLRVRL
ncbi:polysaccharide lyase 8 family protein [Saccharothrix algeriensis]|uniref:Hyaluronate lyase n=3 Tax=Saccharothrix algeriensis TaxID=173560 RepID=A0ABS2SEN4_9PSEU|nr:polysaccharide lyase 8 family protein [Saccharothrix algeriensis]MBM7814727.1 hyaluronate lyase [Saccharothrix algeriensis]